MIMILLVTDYTNMISIISVLVLICLVLARGDVCHDVICFDQDYKKWQYHQAIEKYGKIKWCSYSFFGDTSLTIVHPMQYHQDQKHDLSEAKSSIHIINQTKGRL